MNCERIKSDFNKRFGAECERVYFAGKPVTFLKGKGKILGCCVSVGSYLATEKRDDDRLMIQFSHTDQFLTVNAREIHKNRDNEFFKILSDIDKLGIKLGGARLFFYSNSALDTPKKNLLLSALDAFCQNVPGDINIFRHFKHFDSAMLERMSKADHIFLYNGASGQYFPFNKDKFKIILSHVDDKKIEDFSLEESRIDSALEALTESNYTEFGKILNIETERLIKKNGMKTTRKLFKTALEIGESVGNGVLSDGGIFSIVENKNVDSFVRNVSLEYRNHFGKAPDFYVTDTRTGGMIYKRD